MAKFVKQLKQDKIIQNKLMKVFKKANQDKNFQNWIEIINFYKIDDNVYHILLKMCDSWIKEKIVASKATPPFPLEARSYITWITQLNKAKLNTTPNMPWRIHAVNIHKEGKILLKKVLPKSNINRAMHS